MSVSPQPSLDSPSGTRAQRLTTARRALNSAMKAGQSTTAKAVPRGLTADARFITAARNYRRCSGEYIQAIGAWQRFTATNPHDDPAHHEHHTRVVSARLALNGADEAFALAERVLLNGA